MLRGPKTRPADGALDVVIVNGGRWRQKSEFPLAFPQDSVMRFRPVRVTRNQRNGHRYVPRAWS